MNKKKGMAWLLAVSMLLGLTGCAATGTPDTTEAQTQTSAVETTPEATTEEVTTVATLTPGTYEGEAQGMSNVVKVAVTVSETAIEKVEVLESKDTTGVGEYAYEILPQRVIDAQSIAVDNVSGATVSSAAFRQACSAALSQAGDDISAFTKAAEEVTNKQEVTLETDVVVVGSGMSGLTAACSAVEEGASVIIVERLGVMGGSSQYSGSAMMAAGTYYNEDAADELDIMKEWIYQRYECYTRRDLLDYVFDNADEAVNWISDMGVNFTLGVGGNSNLLNNGEGYMWSHRNKESGCRGTLEAIWAKAEGLGAEMYLETPATDILMNDAGEVIGIRAESKDTVYTIYAKGGVVLACGGYEGNDELFEKYASYSEREVRGTAGKSSAAGDQGDVFKFAEQVGADIAVTGYGLAGYPETQISAVMTKMMKTNTNGHIDLTDEMRRYHDEVYGGYEKFKMDMIETDSYYFYTLFDSSSLNDKVLASLEEGVANGMIYKADTLEDLAKQMEADGLDGNRMLVTVAEYNAFCESGEDLAYGRDPETMEPMEDGPFYLALDREIITGCWGGVKINTNAEVLDTNGNPIPGLYASGECAGGEFFYCDYVCGGTCLSFCAVMGRTGGALAAARAAGDAQ